MLQPRILVVILLMGAAAIIAKGLEFWNWYVNEETLEAQPVVIDTARNGGVASAHGSRG